MLYLSLSTLSACTPAAETDGVSYEIPAIEDQSYTVQEAVSFSLSPSPATTLDACDISTLPEGIDINLSSDETSCEITGAALESMEATEVTLSISIGSNDYEQSFMLTVENLLPDIPLPDDQTFILGETIEDQEYISTAGVGHTALSPSRHSKWNDLANKR